MSVALEFMHSVALWAGEAWTRFS